MFLEGLGIEIFNNLTKISVFSHLNDIVYSPFKLFGRNFCYLATCPPHTAENATGHGAFIAQNKNKQFFLDSLRSDGVYVMKTQFYQKTS